MSHDSNDAYRLHKESEDEANNPVVQGKDHSDESLQRQKGESQAEYNERVSIAVQPVQPMGDRNYLGEKIK